MDSAVSQPLLAPKEPDFWFKPLKHFIQRARSEGFSWNLHEVKLIQVAGSPGLDVKITHKLL